MPSQKEKDRLPESASPNYRETIDARRHESRFSAPPPEVSGKKILPPSRFPETGACSGQRNPIAGIVLLLAAGCILLTTLVVIASAANRSNYHLKAVNGAVEIWQGRFAPMGKERILILPGAHPPAAVKDVYSRNEMNVIAFSYYIDRADTLLEAPEMPEFSGIKRYLKTAQPHAFTDEMRRAVSTRLNTIDMIMYLYKADIAASRGTLADFNTALAHLAKAVVLPLDPAQSDLVKMKIQSINELMAIHRDKNIRAPEAPVNVPDGRKRPQFDAGSPAK